VAPPLTRQPQSFIKSEKITDYWINYRQVSQQKYSAHMTSGNELASMFSWACRSLHVLAVALLNLIKQWFFEALRQYQAFSRYAFLAKKALITK